ncbi:MAG: NAD(P)H-dependent oxidoreductase subunit E [Leptospirales bacterium]|nr:NAD(P)H-dependent oxidoreductase subunit E [Leptospirales bacterium]
MSNLSHAVKKAAERHSNDREKLLDVIRDVQADLGCVSDEAIAGIAEQLKISALDVEGVVTYYHFFSKTPVGKYAVYLNDSVTANMKEREKVAAAFEEKTGIKFGMVSPDGLIGLHNTSCIGMGDQEPAALINGAVFTHLTSEKVADIVAGMKAGKEIAELIKNYGDGQNQNELIKSMVNNNIMENGQVIFAPFEQGAALKKAVAMKPNEVIDEIKKSMLRGRGGAGFPVGMKWETTAAGQDIKYIVCNADEGEPGTFKDRVLLTEKPALIFEGMAVAAYAIGANEGFVYLRAEYIYLQKYLENVLHTLRAENILGKDICGTKGFDFDIKIVLGAGAYVCGEESALLESAEGKRGIPRTRPPFPAQKGYRNEPTSINNVESFCSAARIIEKGSDWFLEIGTKQSHGTKLLSISGDCEKPGVYELPFGVTVSEILEKVGAKKTAAVQVGGASGTCVPPSEFERKICYSDLSTGGSIIIFGPDTDILAAVKNFMHFFVEESCGWCIPCMAGTTILTKKLEKIIHGNGTQNDLAEIENWCAVVKNLSRCGLGVSSVNPILSTLKGFRHLYEERLRKDVDYYSEFDLASSVKESCLVVGRKPEIEEH